MADNQVTTDFIADTSQLEAASMTASAAMANYEKATRAANAAASAAVDQYEKTAAAAHAKVGSAVKLAARDTDQYAKSVANATWQVKALTTAQMKRTLPTPHVQETRYAPSRPESPKSLPEYDQILTKLGKDYGTAANIAAQGTNRFGKSVVETIPQLRTMDDRINGVAKSIRGMQRALMLGGGIISAIGVANVGVKMFRGEWEQAGEAVKQLPFGIGAAASALEPLLGWATGWTEQTEQANEKTARGNKILAERKEIVDKIKASAKEAEAALGPLTDRRDMAMAGGEIETTQLDQQQRHAREMLDLQNKITDAKKRAADLNLSTTPEIENLDAQLTKTKEVHAVEQQQLAREMWQRRMNTAADLRDRLAVLQETDAEQRKIIEAEQERDKEVAAARQRLFDEQVAAEQRGEMGVSEEEKAARDALAKTQQIQDLMVESVKKEVAERRKATEESRRQAEAVLDARLAAEQMRAGGMGATADVYSQTQGTRDELAKARSEGDTAKVEKLVALLSAELQVIGNAAQKQSDDAAQAFQDMLASQKRIEVKSVEQASADFRMQEVMARQQKQDIDKQVKATQAVEERTVEVRDAVKAIKLEAGYGP